MYRKRERRSSLPAATAITAVVLPLLLVYNLTVAVPAAPASVEPEPQPAPVVSAGVELGVSVGSGTEELLAAFREAYPPVTQAAPVAPAADPTTTTTAPPAPTTTSTTAITTTTITTTAAPTTTTTTTTTAAPTTTTTTPPTTHTHPPTTTTVVAASPIDPYPWKDSWPEIAMWEKLAVCESTGDWYINSGNGYFGGIQFTQSSWEYVGGTGRPDQASREEQIYRGALLWERQSWRAWPGCTAKRFGWGEKQTRL